MPFARIETSALHRLAVPPHPRPQTLMNKVRIHCEERMYTTCGECVHKYVN